MKAPSILLGLVIGLGILAVMHGAHIWTLLGAKYN